MLDILLRASFFVLIIVIGFALKKIGVFKDSDFRVLSAVVLKITLPAAIFINFANKQIDLTMLTITLLGLGAGMMYVAIGFLINIGKDKDSKSFDVLNLPGYNIGCFALPFIQNFLGPVGVVTTSLFDTGNAFVCLGGAYGIASAVKYGKGFSLKPVLKALSKSVPFLTYIVMLVLCLTHVTIPDQIVSFGKIIADDNTFLAMLMIGVGFKLNTSKDQISHIIKIVVIRYAIAAVLGSVFYFLLPFDLEIRKALVFLAFSPIGSAVPPFTEQLKGDVGLSSAINSICIVCSIIFMVILVGIL